MVSSSAGIRWTAVFHSSAAISPVRTWCWKGWSEVKSEAVAGAVQEEGE